MFQQYFFRLIPSSKPDIGIIRKKEPGRKNPQPRNQLGPQGYEDKKRDEVPWLDLHLRRHVVQKPELHRPDKKIDDDGAFVLRIGFHEEKKWCGRILYARAGNKTNASP